MAAIPLLVESISGEGGDIGTEGRGDFAQGVVYVGFGNERGEKGKKVHLLRDGQFLGVLSVCSRSPNSFHDRQEPVLEGLADRAVLALLNDQAQNRLKTNEKLSTLGGLTATLLHRFKNDLLGLSHDAKKFGEAEHAELVSRVGAVSDSFLKQVKRLRDFGSAEQQSIELRGAFRDGLKMVNVPANVTVHHDVPAKLPFVSGNAKLVAEVFAILLRNAVEAMPGGGALDVCGKSEGPIGAPWVIVRVKDNGHGIDSLTMKTLFQPKHSAKPNGLGIGLWLAHSYIELLGGRLDVEKTEVGQGSTFVVALPAIAGPLPSGTFRPTSRGTPTRHGKAVK